jgi:hypothetical protein
MRDVLRALTVLAWVTLGACGGEDHPLPATTREFAVQPYGNPACDGNDGRLVGRRKLRLFVNPGLKIDATITGLQRYYHRFGLTFFADLTVEETDIKQVQDLDQETLNAKLQKEFPGVDFSDAGLTTLASKDRALFDRIVTSIMRFQFSGVLAFLERYQLTGQDVTNVVLMQDLATAKSPPELRDGILGLSLSPFLLTELARTGMDAQRTIPLAGFAENFSPLVFIGNRNLKALEIATASPSRDLVVAHEFGHSAGLVHRPEKGNLMYPSTTGAEGCGVKLEDEQIAVMRQGLGLAPPTQARLVGQGAWPPPGVVAGVVRGEVPALRAFLQPFHGGG